MLRLEYRSDDVVIGADLYEKCLSNASRFDRAVGFFSGSVFAACPNAFKLFFERGGRMRVVCCPILDESDISAVHIGLRDRPRLIRTGPISMLDGDRPEILAGSKGLLGWLAATGKLEIRVALRRSSSGNHIYHEKLGLFGDEEEHWIAFSGSANESLAGLEGNFEAVDVFRSWVPAERRRVEQKRRSFDLLWNNETAGVEVVSFAEAATRGLLKARVALPSRQAIGQHTTGIEESTYQDVAPLRGIEETLLIPGDLALREHQRKAIRGWFDAKGRGLLVMATGAGKTITSLAIATKLYEWANAPLLLVIVCPYLHLCAQWMEEAHNFGLDPLLCAQDRHAWYETLSTRLFNLSSDSRKLASVVVSNATFASEAFQSILRRAPSHTLLLADEVHHMGAADLRTKLPPDVTFRLGLSATPERYNDPVGTRAICDYFGPPISHYTLVQALRDQVLCPYRYFPILVSLEEDELEQYLELTRKIGHLMGAEDPGDTAGSYLTALLLRRARLLATARGKIPALVEHMAPHRHTTHNLVYCGDGTVEGEVDDVVMKQVDAAVRTLGRDLGMAVAKYLAETPLTGRSELRRRFTEGSLQGLIAIRCLDEGVDVPETRRAFILASSTNPRQFIQRRGRILRRAPNKGLAEIYDFIVAPSESEADPTHPLFPTVRSLFRRELARIAEFASLAVNGPEAMHALLPLRNRLNLLDYGVADDNGKAFC